MSSTCRSVHPAHNFIDIAGQMFGRWTVLRHAGGRKWLCRCACGAEHEVGGAQLRRGASKSCKSCANVGRAFSHGQASERLGFTRKYKAWLRIRSRLKDESRQRWYGGVSFHPAWADSFAAFDADVPEPPDDDLTLDRIENTRGYEPGNVRWATMKEQARNRRSNHLLTISGRTQCLAAWAEEFGIGESTLRYRLKRGLLPTGERVIDRVQADKLLAPPDEKVVPMRDTSGP